MISNPAKTEQSMLIVKMKAREFAIPPVTDALVIGVDAPIGSEALRRSITLLNGAPFDSIKFEDDTIDEMLVRSAILKKISRESLIAIVMKRIKPFMSLEEVIHLDIGIELSIEEVL
jgi:hypothetical protein